MFSNNSYKSKEKVCMPWLRVYLAITLTKARKKYALLTYLVEQGYIAIIFTMSMEKVCMPKKYGGRLHIVLYVVNFLCNVNLLDPCTLVFKAMHEYVVVLVVPDREIISSWHRSSTNRCRDKNAFFF